jgi:hypothetical protein
MTETVFRERRRRQSDRERDLAPVVAASLGHVVLVAWPCRGEIYKYVATRSSRGGSWRITLVQSRLGLTMTAYTTASAPPSLSRVAESTKFDARLVGITR